MFGKYTALLGGALLILAGCASTDITGFDDPSFTKHLYEKYVVAVIGGGLQLQASIEKRTCEAIQDTHTECVGELQLLPPTRDYAPAERASIFAANNVNAVLVVGIGGGASESNYIGTQTFATATVSGNTATGFGTSVPLFVHTRSQDYDLALFDVSTGSKAWVGGATVKGRGRFGVRESAFEDSLASQVVSSLQEAGHLRDGSSKPADKK